MCRSPRRGELEQAVERSTRQEFADELLDPEIDLVPDPPDRLEVLSGREVLELKYRVHVPPLFKRLIEEFNLVPRAISKYRMGVAALGLVGDSDEAMVINA